MTAAMVAGNPLARAEPAACAYPAAVHAGATQKALRPGWKGRPTRSSHREPGRAAEETGREWGAYLTEQPPPYQRLTTEEAIEKVTAIMEELGFAPQAEAGDGAGKYRLCLRQCPFREVAQQHQDVICSLHLGLMRGALARMRAPVSADRLDPFAEPSLCVARLTARDHPGERQPAAAETR